MSEFELINLAATVTEPMAIPESSDDGLDPNEFLSQSGEHESRNHTVSPIDKLDLTATILNSGFFSNPGRLSDSDPTASLMDSFHFISSNNHRNVSHGESPLEYLQTQNDTLNIMMRKRILMLEETLMAGDDCASVRNSIIDVFGQLSENCYLLHEMYTQELMFVDLLLGNFEAWDRRRSKILRRIQTIKSEDNKYGTKLAELLNRRSDMDAEIEQLESRIALLRNKRTIICREIEETSSVLESKSAKYVNVFRELERQGKEAICGYLYASGLPEQHLQLLLKSEPVKAAFSYSTSNIETKNVKSDDKNSKNDIAKNDNNSSETISINTMGIQPLEYPEPEPGPDPDAGAGEDTPYAKGYAKGTEQLEKLRKGINSFVTHVFPEQKPHLPSTVDDKLNTITEKINLEPILELLTSKLEALSSLKVKTSRMSADYHDQGVMLKDAYRSLDSNEHTLVTLLSEQPKTSDLMNVLSRSYSELKGLLESQNHNPKANYLTVVLHHELMAVARAMAALSNDSVIESQVPPLDKSLLEQSMQIKQDPRSHFRITGTGFRPTVVPSFSTRKVRPKSPATKGVKGE